jgi:hypothetical protein
MCGLVWVKVAEDGLGLRDCVRLGLCGSQYACEGGYVGLRGRICGPEYR